MWRVKAFGLIGAVVFIGLAVAWLRADAQDDLINHINNEARDVREENIARKETRDAKIDNFSDNELYDYGRKWVSGE